MTGGGSTASAPGLLIRPETRADRAAIRALLRAAFGGPAEADLVETLRAGGAAAVALVAIAGTGVVGHVLFSAMRAPPRALGLAPLAVAEGMRRRGIGARLVAAGLDRARAGGAAAVFVLGDPAFYGRFGFTAAAAAPFASPYAGPHLLALELAPGGLPAGGPAAYAAAFDAFA